MPLSARDSREDAMRTARGAFNVSCASSRPPRQIMQEIHRALTLQRVSFKQATGFSVKCQKQSVRFEMEISHLENQQGMESAVYVVRFKRILGDLFQYKDLCGKILSEMKL